jgi:hypothetical protein
MNLSLHLVPSNSIAAKATAHNAFMRFLKDEQMDLGEVHQVISSSADGRGIPVIMDKFAIYLAFSPSKKGERLAKNTVDSYFGQVKVWLLDRYPQFRSIVQPAVTAVGTRLKKYCAKRAGGVVVHKAPACRKSDLNAMLSTLYRHASTPSD